MRFFNTAGPVKCEKHYCLPPLTRFELAEILSLIDQEKYFVLHAPRQVGKTSFLLALMDHLNQAGRYHCLYINIEMAQAARENVAQGMRAILGELAAQAQDFLEDSFLMEQWSGVLEKFGEYESLNRLLTLWAKQSHKPLVLLIDEIDSLVGDTLISVLRQLRTGYTKRPAMFPQSIILCGVRDVRDYRIHSEVCFKMKAGQDRSTPITAEMIIEAKDRLISRRDTHLNQLMDKLKEARVRRVISPMLQGKDLDQSVSQDDIQYVVDLGLIHRGRMGLQIANAIYREVIPNEWLLS